MKTTLANSVGLFQRKRGFPKVGWTPHRTTSSEGDLKTEKNFNVYLFLRDWAGEGERERETQIRSRLQALSFQHRAQHGAQTHELRDHDLSRSQMLNWLSQTEPSRCPGDFFLMFLFFKFIYLFWERKHEWGRDKERGRIPGRLCTVSMELEPMNHEIMTWAEVRCLIDWATQVPPNHIFF